MEGFRYRFGLNTRGPARTTKLIQNLKGLKSQRTPDLIGLGLRGDRALEGRVRSQVHFRWEGDW